MNFCIDLQGMNAPPSKLHRKVLLASVDLNVNVAFVLLVGFAGPFVMVVSGGIGVEGQVEGQG